MTRPPAGSGAAPEVRAAEPGDLDAVRDIYARHVQYGLASFELEPPGLATMIERYEAIVARGLPYLVAVQQGTVFGFAYAAPYRPRPAYRFTVEDSVYVAPGQEGRGLGSALLAPLIELCEAQGYRRMVAVIGDSGNLGSIRLHEKFGFTLVGSIPSVGFKLGRWVDTVILQRPLGDGDSTLPT